MRHTEGDNETSKVLATLDDQLQEAANLIEKTSLQKPESGKSEVPPAVAVLQPEKQDTL